MKQVKTIVKVKTKKRGRVSTEGEDFEKVDHVTNGRNPGLYQQISETILHEQFTRCCGNIQIRNRNQK